MNIAIVDPYNSIGYLLKELKKEGITLLAIYCDGHLSIEEKIKLVSPDMFVKSFKMNKDNREDVINELKSLDIKAVINGSDFDSVAVADLLNKELGTGFGNYDTAACLRNNKYMTNEFVKLAGLATIDQVLIDQPVISEAIKSEIKDWGEVFVKPVSSSASFGGAVCNTLEEIESHIKKYYGSTHSLSGMLDEFLVQKKIIGDEYVVDTVSRHGKHIVIGIYKYNKTYYNNSPIYRSCSTVDIKSKNSIVIAEYCLKVLDVVGYVDGMCHTEVFMHDEKPLLVEINPRISGAAGFLNMMGNVVFNRTQPHYLSLGIKNPSALTDICQIPLKNNGSAVIYFVQSFEKRFIRRFKTEILKELQTFTGEISVLKENCFANNSVCLLDTVAYVLLAGSNEDVLSDVRKLEEFEANGDLFE